MCKVRCFGMFCSPEMYVHHIPLDNISARNKFVSQSSFVIHWTKYKRRMYSVLYILILSQSSYAITAHEKNAVGYFLQNKALYNVSKLRNKEEKSFDCINHLS